ncbi:MAG TPA: pyridoxal-dependent decarboxylase [Actinomycetota bacterium]|nr:pyridoxal-dependent decarboxylase [Actinomycetota bacterium]
MSDPLGERAALDGALDYAHDAARAFLASIDDAPVRPRGAGRAAAALDGALPDDGHGSIAALRALAAAADDAALRSAGPRFFHFVTGGATPAALAADWLTAALDQNPGMWAGSPFGADLERIALEWLRDLFALPREWGGVLTTGATMANYTGLAAARRWWAAQHGFDADVDGLSGRPPVPVFSSGYVHASSVKALGMLGIGRDSLQRVTADATGRIDLSALRDRLRALDGAPAVVVANTGEVNAGAFDPLPDVAELADEHGAWLHVDGAFGLFSRLTPRTAALTDGIERADSVVSDAHKWLNVPYDCGFVFVRDESLLSGAFGATADYYVGGRADRPSWALLGPESSRRTRALAVWATLRAYGRNGYRLMVERHLDLAQRVAARVDEAPELERLAPVPLNIVCFRIRLPGVSDDDLDEINRSAGEALLEDGRVYAGTTRYAGRVAFRPAIVNWRTTEHDVDLLVDVVRELAAAHAP